MKCDYKKNIIFLILFIFVFSALPAYASVGKTKTDKRNSIIEFKNAATTLTGIDVFKVASIQINENRNYPKKQMAIKVNIPRYLEQFKLPVRGEEIAVIRTNMGVIKMKLLSQFAPITVAAFKARVLSGYYNNLEFDKIIGNSILQGGSGAQNNTETNNISTSECNVDARNYRGAVSAAGSDQGGDIGQFTIVDANPELIDNDQLNYMTSSGEAQFPKYVIDLYKKAGGAPWLDFHNVVFGHVFEGMGIVDNILSLKVDENNKPKKSVKIKRIDIVNYKQ
jgi:peptidyl-prolyl cis-trans isomerase B (cyclophilin B)